MSIGQMMLPEVEQEYAGTRRVLERIPFDKAAWKPHAKSFSLGRLTMHVADMVNWMKLTIEQDTIDLAGFDPEAAYKLPASPAALLATFDKYVAEGKAALAAANDARLLANWSLCDGDVTYLTLPRITAIRSFVLNHHVHHRAQLTVYLRLLDVPVPGLYGPSADETGP
jgi:uncharacterized damage-inducible protein DinB